MELITPSEFARRVGVSPQAVHNAIRRGRLSVLENGKLDVAVAAIQWRENRQRAANAPTATRPASTPATPAPDPDDVEAAEIAVWLAWHFGPRERLPSALEGWAALIPPGDYRASRGGLAGRLASEFRPDGYRP